MQVVFSKRSPWVSQPVVLVPTVPPSAFPNPLARMLALDGIRGFAVLLVLLDHASDSEMRLFAAADLNRAGKYGVYLFFVLSAFLLTLQLSLRPMADLVRSRLWIDYTIRRFLRIFPLYAVVLLAYLLMKKLPAGEVVTHLLLREGMGHFWTIAVEVKYYMLLPLIAVALFWAGHKHWAAGLAAGGVVCALGWGLSELERRWSLEEAVLLSKNLAPFLIGSVTAIVSGFLGRNPGMQKKLAGGFEIAASVAMVAIITRIPALHYWIFTAKSPVGKGFDPVHCGALWSVFLLGILHGKGYWSWLMHWRPLRYLGLISFSAYLWHKKFLNDIDDVQLPPLGRLLLYLTIVIAVSTASYFLIERPLANLARRLTTWPLPQPSSARE